MKTKLYILLIVTVFTNISVLKGQTTGLEVRINGAEVTTESVTSDYGKRHHGASWHNGIDYSATVQSPIRTIVGTGQNTPNDGRITLFTQESHGIFYMQVQGTTTNFGYAHLFTNLTDDQLTQGFQYGSFILKKILINGSEDDSYLVIINGNTAYSP